MISYLFCPWAFQSLIGIIEDFDRLSNLDDAANALFQSLIGIIEDFDFGLYFSCSSVEPVKFQSLIGIIEDFDILS